MRLDFVIVELYIIHRAGCGLQDRSPLCMLRQKATGDQTERPSAIPAGAIHACGFFIFTIPFIALMGRKTYFVNAKSVPM